MFLVPGLPGGADVTVVASVEAVAGDGGAAAKLREWASGSYAREAGVELLVRSGLADRRGVAAAWPAGGGFDQGALVEAVGRQMPGRSAHPVGLVAVALLVEPAPVVDLPAVLLRLDRSALDLVLAALAHAAGSHEHLDSSYFDSNGDLLRDGLACLPPLHPWPGDGARRLAAVDPRGPRR